MLAEVGVMEIETEVEFEFEFVVVVFVNCDLVCPQPTSKRTRAAIKEN
jgi:hypothetical protein